MSDTFIPPQPNDQMVEPTLGDEDMTAFLASLSDGQNIELPSLMSTRAGMDVPTGGEDETPDDEPPDDGTPEEPPAPDAGTANGDVIINGQTFARADIERLYEFDQYMRANPDAAQRVAQALTPTGQAPVPPTTGTPTDQVEEWKDPEPPESIDLEDPQTRSMWDMSVTAQRTAWETKQQVNKINQAIEQDKQERWNRQAAEDMQTALSNFRQQYTGLNDEDMASIRKDAGPFVNGMMATLPPVDALFRSMEVAAYANTDLRKKLDTPHPTPTTRQRSERRKQKLGSVSGTPRSAPKVEPRPQFTTDRDMVNALAQELADNMAGR